MTPSPLYSGLSTVSSGIRSTVRVHGHGSLLSRFSLGKLDMKLVGTILHIFQELGPAVVILDGLENENWWFERRSQMAWGRLLIALGLPTCVGLDEDIIVRNCLYHLILGSMHCHRPQLPVI
jgi:hypothetical protein